MDAEPEVDGVASPDEAVVIIKPPFDVTDLFVNVLVHHMKHYASMDFSRYLMYVHPRHMSAVTSSVQLRPWLQTGFLRVVRWDMLHEHEGMPVWDQRLVYNHAMLAYTGRNAMLLMVDIDEFLIPMRPGITSIFDMVGVCAPDMPVNIAIPRRHVIADDWPDRSLPEAPLWEHVYEDEGHPLDRYLHAQKDNRDLAPKSAVNPNFVSIYYIHYGTTVSSVWKLLSKLHTALQGSVRLLQQKVSDDKTYAEAECMVLAHACNMFGDRMAKYGLSEAKFSVEAEWTSALARLRDARRAWLQAGGTSQMLTPPSQPLGKGHRQRLE